MKRIVIVLAAVLMLAALPASALGFELSPPLDGRVLKGFDDVARFAAGHRGVDLAGRAGETVRSGAMGRVHFAGYVAGRGTVSIDHGNGWRTTYQPVRPVVGEGDEVDEGEAIGRLEAGHCSSPCLHWGLTDGVNYADPLSYLSTPPVRLLPAGAVPQSPPVISAATLPADGELPVAGMVTSLFGMRTHPVTGVFKLHDGVDIAASCGTPIHAYSRGTVTGADFSVAYGHRVTIDHDGGLVMAYTHMPGLDVSVGDEVSAGQRIGSVGSTGLSTGCHLHWMAWRSGSLIDPLTLGGGRP